MAERTKVGNGHGTTKTASGEGHELPWSATTPDHWRIEVDGWQWQSVGNSEWSKEGACPRCQHHMDVIKQGVAAGASLPPPSAVNLMIDLEAHGGHAEARRQFFARCDCSESHPGRPSRLRRGCGQWALITPPPRR